MTEFDNYLYTLGVNSTIAQNPSGHTLSATPTETNSSGQLVDNWTFYNGYQSNNNEHLSDIRYPSYPAQAQRNSFLSNPASFPHRPTPVMFGQSFAHPMYGTYTVPPAYVSTCDVFTPEMSMDNNVGDMFNIPLTNNFNRF